MVLSAGIRRLFGFSILFLMSLFSLLWKLDLMSLNLMFCISRVISSSNGCSSLISGGEFLDLKPYDSFAVDSIPFRK